MNKRYTLGIIAGVGAAMVLAGCGFAGSKGPSGNGESSTPMPTHGSGTEGSTVPATDPQLQMLSQYEQKSGVSPMMMDFIGFPKDPAEAQVLAGQMATTLKGWSIAGVKPLVIMEPTFNGGSQNMDLKEFGSGRYDAAVDTYFAELKAQGVTDEQMGTWVPFPEPNTPDLNNGVTDPKLFVGNVTAVAGTIRKHFKGANISIMLDSQTCLPVDESGTNPNYAGCTMSDPTQLERYLDFRPGLIDSFGYQGFTWDNQDSATSFLNAKAAIACARTLGVEHVWLNTGTYSRVNNPNGKGIIMTGNARRRQVLQGVLGQAQQIQQAGMKVDWINIFGQNNFTAKKTGTAEFQYSGAAELNVLRDFVSEAKVENIPVLIFDKPSSI